MDFGRLITAMITPFTETGEIDDTRLTSMVNHLIETGTTAIVACGTTGESPTLTHAEKLHVFAQTLKAVDGRIPVIAGTGGNDTKESERLSKEAESLGVQGLLLVAPYYNRPSQEGLVAHFSKIANAVDVPIMLYNIPGRCGVNIDVDTILRLAEVPNIFAVKEASGDFVHISRLAAKKPDDFLLYSGDDKFTLPIMALGGYGIVSVAAHLVGEEMSQMIQAFVDGNVQYAMRWNQRLLGLFESLFTYSSPSPLKAALRLLGYEMGSVRLPLVEAPSHIIGQISNELYKLGKVSERV